MQKKAIFLVLILAIVGLGVIYKNRESQSKPVQTSPDLLDKKNSSPIEARLESEQSIVQKKEEATTPLDRASERITKKPFGIFVTSQNSPVQPERFSGFHTGTDFEIFPEELDADVSVRAICSGKIAVKRSASGYGGVLVQNCSLNNEPITVIYGHLKLASITENTGDSLSAGEEIGLLGKAFSPETDGERKHLHLGIHRGAGINILGYVASKSALSDWIDAYLLACQ